MPSEKKIKLKIESTEERNWDDVYRRISWGDSGKIARAKVMVVGAGALGNEVLKKPRFTECRPNSNRRF